MSRLRRLLAWAALAGWMSCGEPPNTPVTPPVDTTDVRFPPPVSVVLNDTVSASLENDVTVHRFLFSATAGQEVNLFLQATGSDPDLLQAFLPGNVESDDPQHTFDPVLVESRSTDSTLEVSSTGRIRLTVSEEYTVVVGDTFPGGYAGPYRLWLYPIDRGPENQAAQVAVNDTLELGVLDHPGDVDEYTFDAVAGRMYNVFTVATSGSNQTRIWAEVPSLEPIRPEYRVRSVGTDSSLARQAVGRFTAESTGPVTVRVVGENSTHIGDRGPYRLLVYEIDRQPETASSQLAMTDSVLGESIVLMGDVDDYVFQAAGSTEVNIVVEHLNPDIDFGIDLAIGAPGDTSLVGLGAPSDRNYSTGNIWFGPGSHQISVFAFSRVFGYDGAYNLRINAVDPSPETASSVTSVADSITAERLEHPGDIDQFTFPGTVGQHLEVTLRAAGDTSMGGIELFVRDITLDSPAGRTGVSGMNPLSTTGRFTLASTGDYSLEVRSANPGQAEAQGPYVIGILPFDAAPETAGTAIAVGDSVAESVGTPGDLDEYTLTGTAGDSVRVRGSYTNGSGTIRIEAVDPATATVLGHQDINVFLNTSAPFVIPAGGQLIIRVGEYRNCGFDTFGCGYTFDQLGDYWFVVLPGS